MNAQHQPRTLVVVALIISLVSLIMSFAVIMLSAGDNESATDASDIMEELGARLEDLEEEHDYLLVSEIDNTIISEKLNLMPSLPSFCSLPPSPGPCGSVVPRWYYLPRQQDCIQFPWGGCKGNNNNFVSLEQCRAACQVSKAKPLASHLAQAQASPLAHGQASHLNQGQASHPHLAPVGHLGHAELAGAVREAVTVHDCNLPPDSGPCEDRITRFYHDGDTCKM